MRMWNAISVARACRAGLAGLALVILSVSLAQAVFGPRTTIGKNYQQWSNTQSQNGIDPGSCTVSFCYVLFQPIPQQQPLIVQHVSCRIRVNAGAVTVVALETWKGQTQTLVARSTNLWPVFTSSDNWGVNSPAMHLLKSGERPRISFVSTVDAAWEITRCSISGRLQ